MSSNIGENIVVIAETWAGVHWTAIGAFIATAIAAMVAITATCINYYIFRAHVDPHVIVYAETDRKRPSLINLIIENVGRGLAKDVRFQFSHSIPERAFGFGDATMPSEMKHGPLITGIPSLGPGGKRVITWGQYGGLYKYLGDRVVLVSVAFRSDRIGPFDCKDHVVECPLDIMSFAHTDDSDLNWDRKTADQLTRIADLLAQRLPKER